MSALTINSTVGDWVSERPARSRIFERLGIDYCCGGKRPLSAACAEKGVDAATVTAVLLAAEEGQSDVAPAIPESSPVALIEHIEAAHHTYLRRELPRIDVLSAKVLNAHGAHDPRLARVRSIFATLAAELTDHLASEEEVLFPAVRQGVQENADRIAAVVAELERDHDGVGAVLADIRALTDDYTVPEWGCNTYRALLDALAALERDIHMHVHLENNVLFPRLERVLAAA